MNQPTLHPKERHGCVTTWLILMIIGNAIVALIYLFYWDKLMENIPDESLAQIPNVNPTILGILGILNLIFAILLFQWKKIGFWGFLGTSVITLILNIQAGMGVSSVIGGLVGVAILYGILQIKKNDVSTWEGLE